MRYIEAKSFRDGAPTNYRRAIRTSDGSLEPVECGYSIERTTYSALFYASLTTRMRTLLRVFVRRCRQHRDTVRCLPDDRVRTGAVVSMANLLKQATRGVWSWPHRALETRLDVGAARRLFVPARRHSGFGRYREQARRVDFNCWGRRNNLAESLLSRRTRSCHPVARAWRIQGEEAGTRRPWDKADRKGLAARAGRSRLRCRVCRLLIDLDELAVYPRLC